MDTDDVSSTDVDVDMMPAAPHRGGSQQQQQQQQQQRARSRSPSLEPIPPTQELQPPEQAAADDSNASTDQIDLVQLGSSGSTARRRAGSVVRFTGRPL